MSRPALASAPASVLTLPNEEVHVWCAALDSFREPRQQVALHELLSSEEADRQARYKFPEDRLAYALARALVRTTLSRYLPVAPHDWRFTVLAQGKPRIAEPRCFGHWHFNLSHTRGLVVCAVSNQCEVGVDAEEIARREISDGLMRYCLHSSEYDTLQAYPEPERRLKFFDYWTLKEAYLKAKGVGLNMPLQDFWFRWHSAGVAIDFAQHVQDSPADWQFTQLTPSPRHKLAVAVRRPAGQAVRVLLHPFVENVMC